MAADRLAEAISQTARELPAAQALRLADVVADCPEPAAATRAGIHRLVPTATFERAARRLVHAWGAASGEAVAVGLRAAVRAVQATAPTSPWTSSGPDRRPPRSRSA